MGISDTIFPGAQRAAEAGTEAVMDLIPQPPKPDAAAASGAVPTPPAVSDPAIAARAAAAEEARRRSQYGRASTNPTGGLGVVAPASVAAKSLLGL